MQTQNLYDRGEHYDRIFSQTDDIPFWLSIAAEYGPRLLELGCGTGRLSLPLAQAGYAVTGLDGAQSMLDQAQFKAEALGLSPEQAPVWIQGDFTDFRLEQAYDLVFIPNNTLGHLLDAESFSRFCACVRAHLQPDSVFALDLFVPLPQYLSAGQNPVVFQRYTDPDGRIIEIAETYTYDPATQVKHCLWHSTRDGEPYDEQAFTIRMYFPGELEALLRLHGFEPVQTWGGYDRQAFGPGASKQLRLCRLQAPVL